MHPHPSPVRQAAELRRFCTGEVAGTPQSDIARRLRSLPPGERAALDDVLSRGHELGLLAEEPGPAVDPRLREVLLPDAVDVGQQQLEAGILFALGKVAPLHWPVTGEVYGRVPVCHVVRPMLATEATNLHLPAETLATMMTMLLPRVVDGSVRGLAGLRARVRRRAVHLHLAESPAPGVVLSNTPLRHWAAALAFAEQVAGPTDPLADGLTAAERKVIEDGRVPGPLALASALLRRLRALGDTYWLTVRADGPTGIRVD